MLALRLSSFSSPPGQGSTRAIWFLPSKVQCFVLSWLLAWHSSVQPCRPQLSQIWLRLTWFSPSVVGLWAQMVWVQPIPLWSCQCLPWRSVVRKGTKRSQEIPKRSELFSGVSRADLLRHLLLNTRVDGNRKFMSWLF